ncbi:hypothetical protein FE257_003224 [Aspergillus nanangensis]|uniref:CUE domain-containing protein n=1 Tax=Aspergillus nanangensis TaxID=2582783 RepID=A0AAD4CSQ6_ASPNN|nr:hypothetical protein FE257_003224 [Aspergillus nanangensis]
MASFPPLAPVPPLEVQKSIPSKEWELYTDAWTLLLGLRIESPDAKFAIMAPKDESAVAFLVSFYQQLATTPRTPGITGPNARTLRKLCFLLSRRYLLDISISPPELLDWKFLSGLCCCYPSSSALRRLLSDAWKIHQDAITSSTEKAKSAVIEQLCLPYSIKSPALIADIRLLTLLACALPQCSEVLMAGSDYLDTFSEAYQMHKREEIRKVLVANLYVGLTSLLKGPIPNLSLLLDQLFSLKASAGVGTPKTKKEPTLLSDVICSSDLLNRLDRFLASRPQKRAQDLVASLRTYQNDSKGFHHRYQKQKARLDKGKNRASDYSAPEDMHIHKMSLVTQVQDLFPDLGSGYIVRLLDAYDDNPEIVVAHLLDDSIPSELQTLDKSEPLPTSGISTHHDPMPPHATPPETPSTPESLPARRNIFDKDVDLAELSRDGTDTSALHFGRANRDLTADTILEDRSHHAANKAAIMSALATFDSDDDERDDTYDVADVGGTVDSTTADADADAETRARLQETADMALFRTYKSSPALFARDTATRRSQPRASLKRETGMTDEAIEGWAVMLARDPRRLSKLEDSLTLTAGGPGGSMAQPELRSTSYRRPGNDDDGLESDTDGQSAAPRGRGGSSRGRGRGARRGSGGPRRGGGPAGSGDQNPAASRQKKEENKSSRANHNRRQQRAKKVARAGGMVG